MSRYGEILAAMMIEDFRIGARSVGMRNAQIEDVIRDTAELSGRMRATKQPLYSARAGDEYKALALALNTAIAAHILKAGVR